MYLGSKEGDKGNSLHTKLKRSGEGREKKKKKETQSQVLKLTDSLAHSVSVRTVDIVCG